jgi:hypothetical protein
MTLSEKQRRFTHLVKLLIHEAERQGDEPVLGEVMRSQIEAERLSKLGTGSRTSLHVDKLAVDLLLFRGGLYLTKTEDYARLGAWWKQQDINCRWGGDFDGRPDGNHFSYTPDGVRA